MSIDKVSEPLLVGTPFILQSNFKDIKMWIFIEIIFRDSRFSSHTIQNMGTHGSITGKTMTRIICFDHITTATTPLPNLQLMKRMSCNYKVIYTWYKSRS